MKAIVSGRTLLLGIVIAGIVAACDLTGNITLSEKDQGVTRDASPGQTVAVNLHGSQYYANRAWSSSVPTVVKLVTSFVDRDGAHALFQVLGVGPNALWGVEIRSDSVAGVSGTGSSWKAIIRVEWLGGGGGVAP